MAKAKPIRVTSKPKIRNIGTVGSTYQKVSTANSAIRFSVAPSAFIQAKAMVATNGRAASSAAQR